MLFYQKSMDDLKSNGFQINPYDPCVASKVIDGEQMRNVWHVDDLKVSHKYPWEVTKIAIWLSSIYGDIKIQWEKVLNYLGMTLDYTKSGEVKIPMIPYVKK